ncbi:MAG: ribose ABC transporter substrate-binding protein [Lentisphaerae bacterium]|nr:ribose ABC transporter substrate-binding protein [Lentisphaerota bacterium]
MKIWKLIIPMLLIVAIFSGCSTKKKFRIGVSVPAATHGWTGGVVWNAKEAKKMIEAQNPDVEVIITTAENTAEQVNRIENLLAQRVDALVVLSQEPEPLNEVCKKAKESGVYLVVVSNPLPSSCQDVFVNGSNTSFGEASADALGKLLDGKGDILVMEGIPSPINTDRVTAFRERLAKKYPGIKIMESQPAYWNTEKGLALMENYLQKHKKIDAVWAGDDDVLKGAIKAYQESGRKDIKALTGGGGSKDIVKLVMDKDPVVKATVTYPPNMVAVGMKLALKGLRAGKKTDPKDKEVIIPSEVITADNAKKYYFPDSVY